MVMRSNYNLKFGKPKVYGTRSAPFMIFSVTYAICGEPKLDV